jgi:signal transduction histidine kinase
VLSAQGLAAALRAAARQSPSPVTVEGATALAGVRFPPEVEVAVYFCCLEALQNAAKHAPDAAVTVSLADTGGELVVDVRDDGLGFELDTIGDGGGTGLLGLRDRLAAVGGDVTVTSAPGAGTAVRLVVRTRPLT